MAEWLQTRPAPSVGGGAFYPPGICLSEKVSLEGAESLISAMDAVIERGPQLVAEEFIPGMHNIAERPVAVQGRVEIRPVMYLALSYDHRLIDGKESLSS